MTKPKNLPSGQVVLVDKSKIQEAQPYKVVSQTTLEKTVKEKRPQSEAQKANIKRLVELNKQRALERRGIQTLPDNKIPDVIPDDKEVVYIKPKKASTRIAQQSKQETLQSYAEKDERSDDEKTPQINLKAQPIQYMYAYPPPPPPPRPTKPKPTRPTRPMAKKKETFYDETSDEETTDNTETDTDTEINRYSKKIQKRSSALSKIEEELNMLKSKLNQPAPVNPYAKHSIF